MSAPRSVMITGGNRGIGLELVKQFLKEENCPQHVIVTYRDEASSEQLLNLASTNNHVHLLKLDVTNFDAFPEIAAKVQAIVGDDHGLNLLINNAGILPQEAGLKEMTVEKMREAFEVNCLAPLLLTRSLLPLLIKAADVNKGEGEMSISRSAVVFISTNVASIQDNGLGGLYAYRCSKTALNMAMKNLSIEVKDKGILVMAMHPGWVQTDMGGTGAIIDTVTSCSGMLSTMKQLSGKDHGTFLRYNNTPLTW